MDSWQTFWAGFVKHESRTDVKLAINIDLYSSLTPVYITIFSRDAARVPWTKVTAAFTAVHRQNKIWISKKKHQGHFGCIHIKLRNKVDDFPRTSFTLFHVHLMICRVVQFWYKPLLFANSLSIWFHRGYSRSYLHMIWVVYSLCPKVPMK